MARLTLALLGGFRATAGVGTGLSITSKKARALLAYLALRPGQRHSRDRLTRLLWGDVDEAQGRQSLRQTLLSLRRSLPRSRVPLLITESDDVAVATVVEVDVPRFERLASRAQPAALVQALALYRGDLLSGFHLKEPCFQTWLQGERERLRGRAIDVLERLSTHQIGRGAIDAALETGLRLLAMDSLQESVHRALMRFYLQSGRTAAALNQYRICADALQRELGVEPEPATTTLYRQIDTRKTRSAPVATRGSQDAAVIRFASDVTPLVGRGLERARLERALADAQLGRGGFVAVSGEAGIGKSRLIQDLGTRAGALGCRIVVGRCFESEQVLPFAPWVGVLRSEAMRPALSEVTSSDPRRRAELARLLPELGRGDAGPEGNHLRIFEAVTRVVEAFAAQQAAVLILEDLHWADEMSVRLLVVLGRQSRSWPVLVLASMRDVELLDRPVTRRLLAEVDRERGVTPIRLAPLAEADTLSLVRHLAPPGTVRDAVERLGQRVWQLSEGHPFMVVETMRAVQEGAAPESAEELPLAQRIEELILGRLERLAAGSQKVVGIAAVIGREFEYELLQRAAGISAQSVAESIQDLVRRRLLHNVGERLAFTHDRLREVAYRQLLPSHRRLLHGAVARAMEAVYARNLEPHWGVLAGHYSGAGVWAKATACLRRAAPVAVARGAFREAVAYLEEALVVLDRLPTARDTQEQMIDVRLELWGALLPLAELERMSTSSGEAERTAAALGDQHRLGWASACLSYTLWLTGQRPQACAFAARAEAIGERLGDVRLTVTASLSLGAAHVISGEYAQAEQHLERSTTLLDGNLGHGPRGTGLFTPAVSSRCWLTVLCAERGEFSRGLVRGREGVSLAESHDHPSSLSFACWALGYLWAAWGRADEAIGPLERSLALADEWQLEIMWPVARAWLGSVYAASGRLSDGLALLQQSVEAYRPTAALSSFSLVHLGRAYLLANRFEEALSSAMRASTVARDQRERGHEAWAHHLLGAIASRLNSIEKAEDHYHRAMGIAKELGMPPLLGHCHLGLGMLFSRAGQLHDSEQHLTRAAAMYREMGMTYWLERAEAEAKEH
jgi:DNA-binding SARP family transcriptional activator/tetratricopeptide (TPR) repeat protein